jgi:Domain of unknown function (DUF4430)
MAASPTRRRARKATACRSIAASLALGASLAGCGLGAGKAPGAVQLVVTRDFGGAVLHSWRSPAVVGQETVMSLLVRNATVSTRYSGGYVQSIDGLSGGSEGGRSVDWFYYVNGVEAPQGAASTNVHRGDHIWWDRHDWSQAEHIPAVVGSFPEPFLNGIGGKRLPVRVECADVGGRPCRTVTSTLRAAGVPAAVSVLGSGAEPMTLRVLVGPWSQLRTDPQAVAIQRGPAASGVYVRFSSDGRTLTVLDRDGNPTGSLGAGAGLIAATASEEHVPTWVVTGTDAGGVEQAAGAVSQSTLSYRFAIVVQAREGRPVVRGVPR